MFRDFEQKDRSRPIKITSTAISKVRKTKFDGFDTEQNTYIQEQHQRLLGISKAFNKSEEVGILIDIIEWETFIIMGIKNKIEMKTNPEAYNKLKGSRKNTLLFMHNHPSTSTFSGEDFKTFCTNDSLYIMTIVGNDGSVQTLTKLSNFDSAAALNYYYNLAFSVYGNKDNNGTLAMKKLLKDCKNIGLAYKNGGKKNEK